VDYIRVQIVKCLHGIEEFKLELKSGFKIEFESTKQKRKKRKEKEKKNITWPSSPPFQPTTGPVAAQVEPNNSSPYLFVKRKSGEGRPHPFPRAWWTARRRGQLSFVAGGSSATDGVTRLSLEPYKALDES
jgi:hypothetical protein